MCPAMGELYQYFVNHPNPWHWLGELRDHPVLGYRQYVLSEGLRLGFLLAVERIGSELLRP